MSGLSEGQAIEVVQGLKVLNLSCLMSGLSEGQAIEIVQGLKVLILSCLNLPTRDSWQ